jgi:hypothetical protein
MMQFLRLNDPIFENTFFVYPSILIQHGAFPLHEGFGIIRVIGGEIIETALFLISIKLTILTPQLAK